MKKGKRMQTKRNKKQKEDGECLDAAILKNTVRQETS